ncbi:hypothetical protein SAMN05661096_02390 [Marivirga sericea]|uniref:Uncharacterized protein n=1 Tax=Marivirga sericea TaxID=1028 RepID=A0A1X7K5A3_9BACT|nr:hypothetical protein [Marivirga sericea]SMG35937.1 hypothetical protein SAMN05661096_02390 [Marivirga sericea]
MKNIVLVILSLIFNSCGAFKIHDKHELIDFEDNQVPDNNLKLNGYYFAELEREAQSFDQIQGAKIKYLSVFFIYEDGFVINISGVDGLTEYYCAKKMTFDNTYASAHEAIELMLESQKSEESRIRRICGFEPHDIGNKGVAKISNDSIKIQFYRIEKQKPRIDSFNSAYLYEINGIIKSDSGFVIKNEIEFRTNKTTVENTVFQFRRTEQKPDIDNYFIKNIDRFK